MLRHISLRWLFAVTWLIAFAAVHAIRLYLGLRRGEHWETDWKFAAIAATSWAGLVVLIVQRLQEEPT